MAVSKRQSIALLITFECLLLLIAFAGYGTQGDAGQDQPIAFNVILTVILGAGNVLGLLVALLAYAATLLRKHHRS